MTLPSDEDVEKAAEAAYLGYKTRNQPWNARSHVAKEAWRECARAALSAVNPYEWRPIETAPKDGAEILAGSHYYKDISIVSRSGGKWRGKCDGSLAIESQGDTWTEYFEPFVTHWMPLPLPPTEGV